MNASNDFGRQFYPFLQAPLEHDRDTLAALLAAARQSTLDKCAETIALRGEMIREYEPELASAASQMATRFASGGKLLAFGNGGSATDADDAAIDCMQPTRREWRALPALSLPADSATVSAVANDVGIEHVFTRQLAALGDARDIALGISTSGQASNVVAGLVAARRRGLLTIALTGYDGGVIARDGLADFCFIARRQFVPRIQEGHATLWHALLALVQDSLRTPSAGATLFAARREAVA
jgi:D-sedoheptulose 7-phosphate isomerase